MKDVNFKTEFTKVEDIIYGSKVNVKGYKLIVPIEIGASEDFMMYTVSASNELGQRNISIEIRPASKYDYLYSTVFFKSHLSGIVHT